uniref:HTH psq-type domain-containing protein n=1 Tax=Trichogramma kaykai TaxID=54128 RepID=A0ABD2WU29_9HYME
MEPNRMTQNRETEGEQLVCSSANPASSYNKRVVKTYSREDKLKAIECVLIHGKTKAYVARTYNIPESTLRGWVNRANVALVSKKNLNDEYSASSVRSESPLNNPLTYPVASLAANTPMVPNERRQHNDSDTDAQFKNNLAAFNPTLIPNAVQNLLHKTSYPYTANDLIKTFPPCMAGNHLLGNITPTSIGQMPSSLAQNNPLFMPDGFQNAKSNVNKNNLAAEPSQANFAYALLQQQLHQQQSQRQAANLLNGGTFSNVNSIWGLFPSVFSNFAASSTNSVSSTVTSQNFDNKPSRGIKPISDKPLLSSQTCRKHDLHGCLHSTKEKIDSDNKTHGFTMSKEYIESGIIKGEQFMEFLEGLGAYLEHNHLYYMSEQRIVFYHENTLPMWRTIAQGNWRLISRLIRELADGTDHAYRVEVTWRVEQLGGWFTECRKPFDALPFTTTANGNCSTSETQLRMPQAFLFIVPIER